MNMKKKTLVIFVSLALLLAACGAKAMAPMYAAEPPSIDGGRGLGGGPADEAAGYAPMPTAAAYDAYDPAKVNSSAAAQERMVIMNADLTVVIADPQAKVETISQMASNLGGFVVSMNMYQTMLSSGLTVPQGSISIRVPSDKLDSALEQIKADAVEVRNENRSGQDVTAEYVDLGSRLRSLEAAEAKLAEIMEEAAETEDVLAVFNQLEYYRQQIEVIKGQMKYYEQASSYSLINVTLIAEQTIQPIEIGGWKPQGVVRDAVQALINFLQGFVDFLIWLVLLILPVLIVIFGPIALIIWAIAATVKRRKVKKAKSA